MPKPTNQLPNKVPTMTTSEPTSLDGLETSVQTLPQPTSLQRRFFARAEPTWKYLKACLWHSTDIGLQKRALKIADCCKFPAIKADVDGRAIPSLARCRDRICPLCSRTRGFEAAERATELIKDMNAPRFLTLTLKHNQDDLLSQIDRLMNHFRELRKSDLWKSKCTGGIYTLELTRNTKKSEWHPHLHIVFDGKFMPHSSLKELWERITGDSNIIHLKAVTDRRNAAYYIAEYVAKCIGIEKWHRDHVCEFATALHGRRLINTIGNLHGKKLDPKPEKTKFDHTKFFPSPNEIIRAIADQNEKAITAACIAQQLGGVWCRLLNLSGAGDKDVEQKNRENLLKQMTNVLTALYDELFPHSHQANWGKTHDQLKPNPPPAQNTLQFDEIPY